MLYTSPLPPSYFFTIIPKCFRIKTMDLRQSRKSSVFVYVSVYESVSVAVVEAVAVAVAVQLQPQL